MSADTVLSGEVGRQELDNFSLHEADISGGPEAATNPFLAFIPFADISEEGRMLLQGRQEQQARYDGAVYDGADTVQRGTYGLIVNNRAPNKTVMKALEAYQNTLRYNLKNPEKRPRKLFDFNELLELARTRPFFLENEGLVGRAQAFSDFTAGNVGVDQLLDGMDRAGEATRAVIAKRLRADEDETRRNGACLGLDPSLMLPQRGESSTEGRQTCLSCKAFGSCAIVACFKAEAKGIHISLSERGIKRLRKGLGDQRIKDVVTGEHFEPIKEAVGQMAQELQELIDPEAVGIIGRQPKDGKKAAAREQNMRLENQFGGALVALVEQFGYISPLQEDSSPDDE